MDLTLPTADRATTVGELIEALEEIDPETPLTQLATRPVAGVWISVATPVAVSQSESDEDDG